MLPDVETVSAVLRAEDSPQLPVLLKTFWLWLLMILLKKACLGNGHIMLLDRLSV